MKHLPALIFIFLASNCCLAQKDFSQYYKSLPIHENDLYLIQEHIIDSLKEELNNELGLSGLQNTAAKGHYVYLEKGSISAAKKDMENQLPFNEFVKKYPHLKTDNNLIIVKSKYANHKNEQVFNYSNLPTKNQFIHNITLTEKTNISNSCKGKWIYNYVPKSTFSEEFIIGFYFTSDFGINPAKEQFSEIETYVYVNHLQNKSEVLLDPIKNKMTLDKVLRFLEKLVDVCAALFIHHNRPDLIGFGIANMMVPKMTRPTFDSP